MLVLPFASLVPMWTRLVASQHGHSWLHWKFYGYHKLVTHMTGDVNHWPHALTDDFPLAWPRVDHEQSLGKTNSLSKTVVPNLLLPPNTCVLRPCCIEYTLVLGSCLYTAWYNTAAHLENITNHIVDVTQCFFPRFIQPFIKVKFKSLLYFMRPILLLVGRGSFRKHNSDSRRGYSGFRNNYRGKCISMNSLRTFTRVMYQLMQID